MTHNNTPVFTLRERIFHNIIIASALLSVSVLGGLTAFAIMSAIAPVEAQQRTSQQSVVGAETRIIWTVRTLNRQEYHFAVETTAPNNVDEITPLLLKAYSNATGNSLKSSDIDKVECEGKRTFVR